MICRLFVLLPLLLLIGPIAGRAQDTPKVQPFGDFIDPRHILQFYPWIKKGEMSTDFPMISNSLLIICWFPAPNLSPDPNGFTRHYQISGLDGYSTQEQVERFLTAFYDLDHRGDVGAEPANVIIAGNNWGAGQELGPKLTALSKAKSFSVFYAGGWPFSKVQLMPEPKERLALIREAYAKVKP